MRVAILGSDTVDVRDIDPDSVAFGTDGAPNVLRHSHFPMFLNRDWHRDMLVSFEFADTGIAIDDTEACLTGSIDGVPFQACDAVKIDLQPWCGSGFESALVLPAGITLWRVRRRRD